MNQQMQPVRESLYNYHRMGLDTFTENPVAARRQIMNALTSIQQVSRIAATSVYINSFLDAKSDELTKILIESSKEDRQKAFAMLSQLDPAKTEVYRKLLR